MAEIINLRIERKRKQRKAGELAAEENRKKHSISKKQRKSAAKLTNLSQSKLDGHKRELD